jgi:hypothetical protein
MSGSSHRHAKPSRQTCRRIMLTVINKILQPSNTRSDRTCAGHPRAEFPEGRVEKDVLTTRSDRDESGAEFNRDAIRRSPRLACGWRNGAATAPANEPFLIHSDRYPNRPAAGNVKADITQSPERSHDDAARCRSTPQIMSAVRPRARVGFPRFLAHHPIIKQ